MPTFLKTTVVLLLGSTLTRVLGLAMIPLYTRAVSPSSLGEYDVWFNSLTFAAPLLFAQIWDAVYRFAFPPRGSLPGAVANGSAVMLVGGAAYAAIFPLLLMTFDPKHPFLIFMQGPAIAVGYYLGFCIRAQGRNQAYAASGVLAALVNVSVTAWMLVGLNAGIAALYTGYLVGAGVQALVLGRMLGRILLPRRELISRALLAAMLRYVLPLCAASVAYWALAGYTRLCLAWIEGTAANGLFSIGDRFGVLVTLAVTAAQLAWQELLFSDSGTTSASRRAQQTRVLIMGTLAAAVSLIAVTSATFDAIISREYSGARNLVPILLAGAAANGAANFLNGHFMQAARTRPILLTTALGAAVNVVLSPILIMAIGVAGAALALASSFTVMLVARVIWAGRVIGSSVWSKAAWAQLFLLGAGVAAALSGRPTIGGIVAVLAATIFLAALRSLTSFEEKARAS